MPRVEGCGGQKKTIAASKRCLLFSARPGRRSFIYTFGALGKIRAAGNFRPPLYILRILMALALRRLVSLILRNAMQLNLYRVSRGTGAATGSTDHGVFPFEIILLHRCNASSSR